MWGYVYALGCAFAWAVSLVLLKLVSHHSEPLLLNWHKNLWGLLGLLITYALVYGGYFPELAAWQHGLLILSGAVGIGVADAMALWALKKIEGSQVAILEALYTPMVVILAVILLHEWPSLYEAAGMALVGFAVVTISVQKARLQLAPGSLLFMAALFLQAVGIVMIKPVLPHAPLLWVVTMRMVFGVLVSYGLVRWYRSEASLFRGLWGSLKGGKARLTYVGACLMSSYVAMILWVAGYKYNEASVAAVLNQTSTFITLFLAALILRERLTKRKILASIMAFLGVVLIVAGG